MARASATRRAMPPESSAGISVRGAAQPHRMQLHQHERADERLRQIRVLAHRKRDVLEHVEIGEQRAVLEQHAHALAQRDRSRAAAAWQDPAPTPRPARDRRGSAPVISRSSVVLPVPLGPMIAVMRPRRTLILRPGKDGPPADGVVHVAHVDDDVIGGADSRRTSGVIMERQTLSHGLRRSQAACALHRRSSAGSGKAVQLRALRELLLAGREVGGLAAPGLERRVLQRAAVAERELPGQRPELVHQ